LSEVEWELKDWEDTTILLGQCPGEHESGTSSAGDMHAGFHSDSVPYIKCKHKSCTLIPEVNRRLHESGMPGATTAADAPPLELTLIAHTILDDMENARVSLHHAPTGSGKSYSNAMVAVARWRLGLGTVIAVPTIKLAREMKATIEDLAPDAAATGAVALICHHTTGVNEHEHKDGDDLDADYPIFMWTRIVICTHAQLMRRGYSKFMRPIYEALKPKEKETSDGVDRRPPFAFLIDEEPAFTAACHQEIFFDHRVAVRVYPDESGALRLPILECPFRNCSGSCTNCGLVKRGGEQRFNVFGIRELAFPSPTGVDRNKKKLRKAFKPVRIKESDYTLGPEVRVGPNTFAASLLSWRGIAVETNARKTAAIFNHRPDKGGNQPAEENHEIIAHYLKFAFRPIITWEMAIDSEGNQVDPHTLRTKIKREKDSSAGIGNYRFPWYTCQVRRLRFADLLGFEKLRRYADTHKVGIAFTAATMTKADSDVLHEVWPELVERQHPYPNRKVRQVAVAFVENPHGADSLVEDGHLLTEPLENLGLGLVFVTKKKIAKSLYEVVKDQQPSVRLAVETDAVTRQTLHGEAALRCFVTYSRGVLGLGVNIKDVRFLVVDARAFRAISSFTPGEITAAEFERAQAEERLCLILQNVGRAIRGEEGKTVAMIILNADGPLREAIAGSEAILDGSELPPVIAAGTADIKTIVDQARRWLEADGGRWPDPDPTIEARRAGRRKGTKKKTVEMVLAAAEIAIAKGTSWSQFRRAEQPQRTLSQDEVEALNKRFQEAKKRTQNGSDS
jgi:hypothetical protein